MRRITAAIAATTLTITLAGCNSNNEPEATSSPTATPTVSETPTPRTPEEQAKADAVQTITRYYEVQDELGQNPQVPLSKLRTVSISSDLQILRGKYQSWRTQGWTKTGTTRVVTAQVEDVNLDNSAPDKGRVPTVTVTACVDASDVDVKDANGVSQVKATGIRNYTDRYVVANYQWEANPRDGWRVASVESKKMGEPCGDS